jgi:hypothetical protein
MPAEAKIQTGRLDKQNRQIIHGVLSKSRKSAPVMEAPEQFLISVWRQAFGRCAKQNGKLNRVMQVS